MTEQPRITWKRDAGTKRSVITSYTGTTAEGIEYNVESTDEWDAIARRYRRTYRAFRKTATGRWHPAKDGGPQRSRAAAYAQAEADFADVLADMHDDEWTERVWTGLPFDAPEADVESARQRCLAEERVKAEREDRRRYGFSVGDLVVFADPDDTGIDTDLIWRVSAVHAVGTINAYADLTGYDFDQRSASYFDRLAFAPRCGAEPWGNAHEFVVKGDGDLTTCGLPRTHPVHNTDRARAERTIHAARDHAGAATGTPYGGEWPGTTVITESTTGAVEKARAAGFRPGFYRLDATPQGDVETPVAPSDLHDEAAWAGYAASLPAPTPEAMAEVAVEMSTWTAQRRAAAEAFRSTARTIRSLRAEGLALPGSREYTSLRGSMRHFRELIATCDRQNDALRRELTTGSL
jgi:hypothetical protein